MLVISLSSPGSFVDYRPIADVTYLSYFLNIYLCMGCLILCAVAGFAAVLVADAIAVRESNGAKKTIPQRLVQFFREYKSEIKKVVWPGPKSVVKNTVIVLVMCLIVGAFIWLLDFGLGKLLELILHPFYRGGPVCGLQPPVRPIGDGHSICLCQYLCRS